jgi:DUF1680 family protein
MPEDIETGGIDAVCPECAAKFGRGEPLAALDRVRLVELPLNARIEDVVGSLDERLAVREHLRIELRPQQPLSFDLCLRIPAWCEKARLKVNGQELGQLRTDKGYVHVQREWKSGDAVEMELPMEIQRIESHPEVKVNAGRVALQRGPLVYCLEGVDNAGHVRNLALSRETPLRAEQRPELLGGITVIRGTAQALPPAKPWGEALYRPAQPAAASTPAEFVAVPYCVWDNSEPGEMVLWLPELARLAEAPVQSSQPAVGAQ